MTRHHSPDRQAGRKQLQLCRQVRDALSWSIGSTIHDDELNCCQITSVEPLPGNNRMLVRVTVPPDLDLIQITERLTALAPALRSEVAQAITRRKAPELVYLPVRSER